MADMGKDTKTETETAEREGKRQCVSERNQEFIEKTIQELDLTEDRIDASDDAQLKEWLTRKFKGVTDRLARIENEKDDFKKDAKDNADNAKKLEQQIADLKNRKGDLFDETLGPMKEDHERDRKMWDEKEEMRQVALQEQEEAAKTREDIFKAGMAKLRREVKDKEKRVEEAEAAFSAQKESVRELGKTKRELEKTKQEIDNINRQYDKLQEEKGAVDRQLAEARVNWEAVNKVARDTEADNKNIKENNENLRTQLENLTREKNGLEESSRNEISSLQEKIQEIERESALFGSRRGSNDDRASTGTGRNDLGDFEFNGNASQPSQHSDEENEGSQCGRSQSGTSRKSDSGATRRLEEQLREKDEELATVKATAAALEQLEQLREKEGKVARTKGNVTALEDQLQQLKEKEGELAKAKDDNTATLENQARQLQEKEGELTNAKAGIAVLEKQLEQLQEEEEELTQAKTNIAALEDQLQQLKEKDGELAKAKDGEIAALEDQVWQLKKKEEELDRVKDDIAALNDKLNEKNDELIKTQQNVASLEEEVREQTNINDAEVRRRRDETTQLQTDLRQANEEVEKLQADLQEARERAVPGGGNTGTGVRGQDVAAAEAFFNAKMADFAGHLDRLRESHEGSRDIQDLRDAVAASGARAEAMFPEMARRLDGFVRSTRDRLNDMFHDVRGNGAQALRDRLQEMRDRLGRAEHFRDAYRAKLDGGEAGADTGQLQDRVRALTASAATLREQIQKLEELLQALEAKRREWPGVEGDSSRSFQSTLEQIELARQAEDIQVAGLQAGIRVLEDELASKAGQVPPPPPQDELLRLQGQLDQARSDFQAVQDEAGQFVGDFVARLTDLSTLAREQITGRLDDQIYEFQTQNQNQSSAETASEDRLKSQALAELLHDRRQWTQDVMEAADAMRTGAADRHFAHQGTQTDLAGDAGGFRFGTGGETWCSRHNVRVGRCCEGDWILRGLNSLAFLFMIATAIAEIRQYNAWRDGNAVTRALYMTVDDNTYCLRTPNYDWFLEWLATLLGRR
ncbi:hypothetical protein DL764_002674 [Monosporascus ibericus]|uniref:Uncharacterized protein n=1 Tax=Monosporascus ibericus TaxID=155417 RepID=A0A4Q4TKU0_9PEZI|nr:hypothetical protein DL764_002674 [Monosporascus ibericus]